MTKKLEEANHKTYWSTWVVLLALTVVMILAGLTAAPRGFIVGLLLVAMFTKAVLISGNFMHLRFEKVILALIFAVGVLFTAAALFLGIAPDGVRILSLSPHGA